MKKPRPESTIKMAFPPIKFKPYAVGLNEFLISTLKLTPNRNTQDDLLFTRKGMDYEIYYNPRCQILYFVNPDKRNRKTYRVAYDWERESLSEVTKWWEDIHLNFFIKTGLNLDNFLKVVATINFDDFEISQNQLKKFDESEQWKTNGQKYFNMPEFKYAYFGPQYPPQPKSLPPELKVKPKESKVKTLIYPPHLQVAPIKLKK